MERVIKCSDRIMEDSVSSIRKTSVESDRTKAIFDEALFHVQP